MSADDMARVSGRVLRERANMSFCIVVIFFAVFFVIVLTEIFLIDQSSRSRNRRGHSRLRSNYDEAVIIAQHGEDYLVYQNLAEDSKNYKSSYMAQNPLLPYRTSTANLTIPAKDGVWQSVAGTRYKFFVFSAYYDWRGTRMVRVMAATKTRGPDRVWCLFWYSKGNNTHGITVPGKIKAIRENWNLKYSACFILCPLQPDLSPPKSVSIVTRLSPTPANRLVVNHYYPSLKPTPTSPPGKIEVCVKPIHFYYNQSLRMLEFIELNNLLGMDHITFYNDTMSPQIDCILHHYIAEGKVTVLPWRLDMASQREIRTEGLFAALNDCLYRSMYKFSHVALLDLDEIVMPRHNDTIQQFMEWMGTRLNTKSTGSYSFQNAFFYLQWPDDESLTEDPFENSLISLTKTRRRAKLHPHKQRSKYICRPEYVIEAGNHFVWEFVPGHGTVNVPSDAAILNHYRVCEFGGDDCIKSASVVDRTAFRYRERLLHRVKERWTQLSHKCSLQHPIPKPKITRKVKTKTPS
ncbi:beta-1,4-galactosyltransferase galt-1 isoform X2 [Halyomorpha halys]|uniref:beta-1,4-galactosyltransferase galt-1 isoform X2 n=1 Tax=Halyomorpha halys TaxID=286706 RepID=UPI0006D52169|nr:beta-1,4-galactosyltransferase galt-1 isoform X2 [Halyomorpha halys]